MRNTLAPFALFTLSGCLVQPTNVADIAAYNAQVFQLWTPLVGAGVTAIGIGVLWVKSNIDKRAIADEAKRAAEVTAAELAKSTEIARDKVLSKIEESHRANYEAIDKANHTNEKILALQEAAARPELGRPVKVEITGKPGIVDPLIVTQKKTPPKRKRK